MTQNQFYQECKKSPSGLLIHIWGNICSFAISDAGAIVIATGKKSYIFSGLGTLNQKDYCIFDCDGVKHGKMTAHYKQQGYVVCDSKMVCGAHASSWVAQYHGCSPNELSFK